MNVTVKLIATYREFLPPKTQGNTFELRVPEGATAVSVLAQLDVPTDGSSVILVDGRTPAPDQLLKEGETVCAFPAIAGGAE